MTSDRPETEQEDHQAILFSTGIFSDSDEEEENQFGLNQQQIAKPSVMKLRVLMGEDN